MQSQGPTSTSVLDDRGVTVSVKMSPVNDHLCGLVVRVPGCKPRGPGFDWVWNGVHSVRVRINEDLPEIKAAPV
jgi:hypothetical protein